MTEYSNDIVCLTSGSLVSVQGSHGLLRAAGIESRVVGDDLTAGLGAVIPGSVELWIRSADIEGAMAAIAGADAHHRRESELQPYPTFVHPESDGKPDRTRGPRHGAPPHRPLPS